MQTGLDAIRETVKRDHKKTNRQFLAAFVILFALLGLFLCMRTTEIGFISPVQAVENIAAWIRLSAAKAFDLSIYDNRREIIAAHAFYYETRGRVQAGVPAVVLGAVLSMSGVVFQCAFHNPIATPAMLGTSSGVRIANLILVLQYSVLGTQMVYQRYLYGYLCSIGILAVLMAGAKIMSKKTSSAADILLLGTVFSRIAGQIVNYIQAYVLDDTDYLAFQEMNLYGAGNYTGALLTAVVVIVAVIPLFAARMSLNVLCFGDDDAHSLGIRAGLLRGTALICCTLLTTTALVQAGDVGMLAMLVPIVCRYVFGADMRQLILGSALGGGIIMLLCEFVTSLFAFHDFLSIVSTSVVVEIISAPLMIFVVFKNRRGWE